MGCVRSQRDGDVQRQRSAQAGSHLMQGIQKHPRANQDIHPEDGWTVIESQHETLYFPQLMLQHNTNNLFSKWSDSSLSSWSNSDIIKRFYWCWHCLGFLFFLIVAHCKAKMQFNESGQRGRKCAKQDFKDNLFQDWIHPQYVEIFQECYVFDTEAFDIQVPLLPNSVTATQQSVQ